MRNNVKITFQLFTSKINSLKQNPLYMKLYFNNKGVRISTGHYIHARDWDKKKRKLKGNSDEAHAINESLNSLRAQVIMTSLLPNQQFAGALSRSLVRPC
jgi:Arm DNA-binding domain